MKWPRFVCVFACLLLAVTGCSHPIPEYESKYTTPAPEPPTAAIALINDPYTGGASSGTQAWPAVVTAQLRQQNIGIDAAVGTPDTPLTKQVGAVVQPTTKVVVIFGSAGDSDSKNAGFPSDLARAVLQVKKTAPESKILMIGPAWIDGKPPKPLQAVRDTMKAEARTAGATFIDPITDGWFVGQPDLIGPDRVTLTDAGHAYLAGKMAPLIAQQLQPLPAAPPATPR